MALSIQSDLNRIRSLPGFGKYFARALQRIEDAINQTAEVMGVDATQKVATPPPVQGLSAKAAGGFVHFTITDNAPIRKNLQYFVEYSTDPTFGTAHTLDLGASRTHPPIALPAMDDNSNPQTWYARAYSQYHGSDAGKKVNFGGTTPAAINPGGSLALTLLPSTGAGTASPFGTQAGQGLGKDFQRLPLGPKRNQA